MKLPSFAAMNRKKPDVDVVNDVLLACKTAWPESVFINSLYAQYHERGGLSKKQLQGLHAKASKLDTIPPARLATLEAMILKKPTRFKNNSALLLPEPPKDDTAQQIIAEILSAFPQHKRVLFFKLKTENNEGLSHTETEELKRFHTLLLKKKTNGA